MSKMRKPRVFVESIGVGDAIYDYLKQDIRISKLVVVKQFAPILLNRKIIKEFEKIAR